MSTLSHSLFNTDYCHLRCRQAQKKQLYLVTLSLPTRYPSGITTATQRRLEGKAFSFSHMLIYLAQHQPACTNCDYVRLKGAQSFGD